MSSRSRKTVFAALPLLLVVGGAFAAKQENAPGDAVFSTDVDVVNIFATVRDKKGRLINDLNKQDFVLKENGKRQEIKYFARQTDLPLTIGLLVDTSLSQRRVLEQERSASYRFFEQVLAHDEDLAFVISFDADVELLQDLTGSKNQLERALAALQTPRCLAGEDRGATSDTPISSSPAAATPVAGAEEGNILADSTPGAAVLAEARPAAEAARASAQRSTTLFSSLPTRSCPSKPAAKRSCCSPTASTWAASSGRNRQSRPPIAPTR